VFLALQALATAAMLAAMRSSRRDLRGPGWPASVAPCATRRRGPRVGSLALAAAIPLVWLAACRAPSSEDPRDAIEGGEKAALRFHEPRDATRGGVNRPALPGERGRESPLWINRPATRASGCTAERAGAPAAVAGRATYYDATDRGSCSFDPPREPSDRMVAALSGADYAHASWCGACLAVAGPLGDVVVRVVDQCPGCRRGDLDLSREAFAKIAPLSAGRTKVAWREVPCPVTGPVVYQVKPGSNPQWTAIQLRNHRHRIARLEARDAGGVYHAIARTDDNYFVAPGGLGPGPYALRVSDVHGHALEDDAIALGSAAQPGAAQFPRCR
jgi:expansin (peptidoglycan-binding protein)